MTSLRQGDWEADLLPELGGSIAALRHRGINILRPASTGVRDPLQTACFPLAPYCNRIRDGRFVFAGREVVLPPNFLPELHSLHGLSWERPWRVESLAEHKCVLVDDYDGYGPWPWTYRAQQRVRLGTEGCAITLVLTNRADTPMPAGLGLHPYFRRQPETRVRFTANHLLLTTPDCLPTGITAPLDHFGDWVHNARLPSETIDHCFAGWDGAATITDDFGSIVLQAYGAPNLHLYAPADGSALCLEPVTHTPDAPNRAPSEMIVLPPGCSASVTMRIAVKPQ